jgi:fructose-1,6-bisphosphatase/inositol monophosphatase family enzyme
MPTFDHQSAVDHLIELQRAVRDVVIRSHGTGGHEVTRSTQADTIYAIDADVEPIIEDFCREWSRIMPLVLIAEGIENEGGVEGVMVFPQGSSEDAAQIRLIIDPIDGTRGIMYDKRPAWSLAGIAPNKGAAATRLRDIEVAVMTELPTSKMGFADVLWAVKGNGAKGWRVDLRDGGGKGDPLNLSPSRARTIDHGFATVSDFFPGTKVLAGEIMEHLVKHLVGALDVTRATVFEDQYISTGGQFYELIVGHDRFVADLRPLLYKIQKQPEGLCCHPYDCAAMLIAEEAGVLLTDGLGKPLDGPLDVTTGIAWAGYANPDLQLAIEPLLTAYLRELGA